MAYIRHSFADESEMRFRFQEVCGPIVVEAVVENCTEVLVASVDGKRLHVLGRCRDHKPRLWFGRGEETYIRPFATADGAEGRGGRIVGSAVVGHFQLGIASIR